jgi:AraC family transcriptional regulator
MSDQTTALNVSVRDLPAVHTACIRCPAQVDQGQLSQAIRESFQKVQQWLKELGLDPYTSLTIGVIYQTGGQLSHYDCCVQAPEGTPAGGDEITIQDLPGGRYAVLTIAKDPAVIGPTIGRFYQEYLPQSGLQVDASRPTYEIYFERTMEYCVPIS